MNPGMQDTLGHILTALQIAYAHDSLVKGGGSIIVSEIK